MKNSTLTISAVLMLASAPAFAGHGEGNGGGAYVCRSLQDQNKILWAELVDLWEGRSPLVMKLAISKNSRVPAKKQAQAAVARLFALHPELAKLIDAELKLVWKKIDEALKRGDTGTYLSVVDDSLDPIRPRVCPANPRQRPEYEQVINYESEEVVRVDTQLYQGLQTETDRAALAIHEAVYKVLRDYQGERDSRGARWVTAHLFAQADSKVLQKALEAVLADSLMDEGVSSRLNHAFNEALGKNDVAEVRRLLAFRTHVLGDPMQVVVTPDYVMRSIYLTKDRKPEAQQVFELIWRAIPSDFEFDSKELLAAAISARSTGMMNRVMNDPRFSFKKGDDEHDWFPHVDRAVHNDCVECLKLLLDDGRFEIRGDDKDNSPIQRAIKKHDLPMVRAFLESKNPISVNEIIDDERTLLQEAIVARHPDTSEKRTEFRDFAIIDYLLARPEINVNLTPEKEPPTWYYAVQSILLPAGEFMRGDFEMFSRLVKRKDFDVNATGNYDDRVGDHIIRSWDDESRVLQWVEVLMDAHPEIDPRQTTHDYWRSSMLERAREKNFARVVAYLEKRIPQEKQTIWDWLWSWVPKF